MVRPMIHSTKHYVQTSPLKVAATVLSSLTLVNAKAVEDKSAGVSSEVEEGSTIKAIYCEYWLVSDEMDAAASSFIFNIEKISSDGPNQSFADANFLYGYKNKKNVLFTSQGLMASDLANPVPIVRQWIKIPKGKQRFGLGDKLRVNFAGLAGAIEFCGLSIYKEYQ